MWDSAGPIAVVDKPTADMMVKMNYAAHPTQDQVDEYNRLLSAVTSQQPASTSVPAISAQQTTTLVANEQAPPVPQEFTPPEGWLAHPTAPGYYYKDQDVKTEAQLREAGLV